MLVVATGSRPMPVDLARLRPGIGLTSRTICAMRSRDRPQAAPRGWPTGVDRCALWDTCSLADAQTDPFGAARLSISQPARNVPVPGPGGRGNLGDLR